MDKEPLLPYSSPRRNQPPPSPPPPLLCTLPEDDEVSLPLPMTPSEFKDRLIFGSFPSCSSPKDPSPLVDALTLNLPSSRPSSSSSSDPIPILQIPPYQFQQQHQQQQQQQQQEPQSPSWLIDPNFAWSNTNLHRSKTAPAMAVINDFEHPSSPKPQFVSQSIVRQACVLLVVYLSLGVLIYWFYRDSFSAIETHPVVDGLYFCIVTMCTIGYGDIIPNSTATKLFSIMFVLVGFGFIDILLTGMVSYVLDLQESYLLGAVKGRSRTEREKPNSLIIDVKKGRMRIRMKVALALGVVVLCIGIGVAFLHFVELLGWLDAFYLSVMSVTTVGYGDRAFESMPGRIFASIWLLVSTVAVARAFLYLAEARVDKRHRKMTKWVLAHDMTVSEFLAADIDNNGFVRLFWDYLFLKFIWKVWFIFFCVGIDVYPLSSYQESDTDLNLSRVVCKSEYVIYKLKEMEKVSDKDILQICKQFERLDSGNCGKITLADLMESHHC